MALVRFSILAIALALTCTIVAPTLRADHRTQLPAGKAPAAETPPKNATPQELLAIAERRHEETYRAANYVEAIAVSLEALHLAERSGTLVDQAPFVRHLAYDYWLVGNNTSAIEYSQRLLDIASTLDDNRLRAQGHRYLAQIYNVLGETTLSRTHGENALRFATLTGDQALRMPALNTIALADAKAGAFDEAERKLTEIYAYWEKQGNRRSLANALANIADLAIARQDFPRALELYESILKTRTEIDDRRGQVRALSAVGGLLRRLDRADEAYARLTAMRAQAESIGDDRLMTEFFGVLAEVQEARGDFPAALASERLATVARERIASEAARLRAADLESRLAVVREQQEREKFDRALALREAELRAAAAEVARARSDRFALIDGILLVVVMVAAGWLVLRSRRHSHRVERAPPSDPWADHK